MLGRRSANLLKRQQRDFSKSQPTTVFDNPHGEFDPPIYLVKTTEQIDPVDGTTINSGTCSVYMRQGDSTLADANFDIEAFNLDEYLPVMPDLFLFAHRIHDGTWFVRPPDTGWSIEMKSFAARPSDGETMSQTNCKLWWLEKNQANWDHVLVNKVGTSTAIEIPVFHLGPEAVAGPTGTEFGQVKRGPSGQFILDVEYCDSE